MTTCIYHSKDLDGWMSAAIVKHRFPSVKLIGWNYGDPIPEIDPETNMLFMVDISFPPPVMFDLSRKTHLVWIDHHARTITETEEYFRNKDHSTVPGNRNPRFAACELTWNFLFPDDIMPELVRLLGRYDCFGHKGTDEEYKVLTFQYGARQVIFNPEHALQYLERYLSGPKSFKTLVDIHNQGEAIYKYLCTEAQQKYKQRFDILFPGFRGSNITKEPKTLSEVFFPIFKFAAVNAERFNPVNFGIDYHKDGYDGFASFWYDNYIWNFSLYNDNGKVDCSLVAKTYGGGGHPGASGFRIKNLSEIFK